MSLSPKPALALACFSLLMLWPALLPGTADVNVWYAWVEGLNRLGFVDGFNQGEGHILHPPLGLLLLVLSHNVSPWIGLPVNVWPAYGITGYDVSVWLALTASAFLVLGITRNLGLAILFQLAFALNSVVYGYFDIYGAPFWLLAMHAMMEARPGRAAFLALIAMLIKWQFLVFMPFAGLWLLRSILQAPRAERPSAARQLLPYAPATLLLVTVALVVGRGSLLSLARGFAHDTLSGYAMNLGWILTWAMHLRWPESYGPLEDGLIALIRTQDTRVLGLMRVLFCGSFGLALWQQWRRPNTPENLLRFMLAGYLAYFLFNKGAHENHLVPAMLVSGYLAWRVPRWRSAAIILAIAANLNMFFFYSLDGSDRGRARVLFIDWSLPLAVGYVAVIGCIYLALIGCSPRASRCRQASCPAPSNHV